MVALNNAIPGRAAAKTTARSPITVVDQWSGFSASEDTSDTSDGVHPIDSGSGRWPIAGTRRWTATFGFLASGGAPGAVPAVSCTMG